MNILGSMNYPYHCSKILMVGLLLPEIQRVLNIKYITWIIFQIFIVFNFCFISFDYLRFSNKRSLLIVLNVTDIIFGCPKFGSKSSKSIECIEYDGGRRSLTFLTQLRVCIVDAKLAKDDEPAAIVSNAQIQLLVNLVNDNLLSHIVNVLSPHPYERITWCLVTYV